jgi:hypothetical protein
MSENPLPAIKKKKNYKLEREATFIAVLADERKERGVGLNRKCSYYRENCMRKYTKMVKIFEKISPRKGDHCYENIRKSQDFGQIFAKQKRAKRFPRK